MIASKGSASDAHPPVAVAVVGLGFGQQVLVPAFRGSTRCEVRAVCASRPEKARRVAAALDIPVAAGHWRELIADPTIQALALAVPPAAQMEIAVAAAEAGKHLFCEKPLAADTAQARAIAAAARAAGIVHAMDFLFPEIDAWRKTRELLAASAVGRIRHVALAWRVETYSYGAGAAIETWKKRRADGGGTLNTFASHTMHYLEWLFGPIAHLRAALTPRGDVVEARVHAWVEFAAGFSGELTVAADAYPGMGHRLDVFGETGTLILGNETKDHARGFTLSLVKRGDIAPASVALEPPDGDGHPDGRVLAAGRIAARFIGAILGGPAVAPDFSDGVRTQILLDTIREAHRAAVWHPVAAP